MIAFDMWMVTWEKGQWVWLLLLIGWTPIHRPRPLIYGVSNWVGPFLILIVVSLKMDIRKGSILNHYCQGTFAGISNPGHGHAHLDYFPALVPLLKVGRDVPTMVFPLK